MRALWRRFKNGYLNLNLQTKFTIALISIVVIRLSFLWTTL